MKELIMFTIGVLMYSGVMANEQNESTTTTIDVTNFNTLIVSLEGNLKSEKPWFVNYSKPNECESCQELEPVW